MPRIANDTDAMIADITRRLQKLVDVARKEGRDSALEEVRAIVGGTAAKRGRPAGSKTAAKPARKATKPRKKRKNPWDKYTPAEREARIRKMLAGRGIKRKAPAKAAAKRATKTARKTS